MKQTTFLLSVLVVFVCYLEFSDAWKGLCGVVSHVHVRGQTYEIHRIVTSDRRYYKIRRSQTIRWGYCACWYRRWGCSYYRWYWRTQYYDEYLCQPGWTHNGDQNCNIPVCRPSCQNGGTCENPNWCNCPSTHTGATTGCTTATCSYQRPCYPGDCQGGTQCTCEAGFVKERSSDGCIIFNSTHTELSPIVGKSNVTVSHIRRTDNKTQYMFILEGLEEQVPGKLEVIWSNQKRFNNLRFEYETYFVPPDNLPKRPTYVHESEIGIVESIIEANVSKVARNGGIIRDPGSFRIYKCEEGFSKDRPETDLAKCEINDDQFRTLIEHGDWLNIKFKSKSGGFQQLVNIDQQSTPYAKKYYTGLQDVKEVQFNFDFIAPKHCSEPGAWGTCDAKSTILLIEEEFTKNPIKMFWSGWTDDLSGVWEYYVEIFKLSPNPKDNYKLVEMKPLSPLFTNTSTHRKNIYYPTYMPDKPGMYSVLVETRDIANNSRTSRRLVLFDDQSEITLNENLDGKLYVSSAVAETGYKWQTASEGEDIVIKVNWANHFVNKIHEDNMLLNAVASYPIQFKEIQDDGLLFSMKYVNDSLDDHEGHRTLDPITNYRGIVKFEMAKVYTEDVTEPISDWVVVTPFKEETSFTEKLRDGSRVRVWIRATDAMGNTKTNSTFMRLDRSPPEISRAPSLGVDHKFIANVPDATTFNYTSRATFVASDDQSGVHKIGFKIGIKTAGKEDRVVYEGFAKATIGAKGNPLCDNIEGTCFIPNQQLDLDNCWFLISKSDLAKSTASVEVTAYNQALLTASTTFDVGPVKNLQGLEKYNGPENMRIESPSPKGFRVAWDLPEKSSCYGRAEIVLVLLRMKANKQIKLETYYVPGTSKHYDILGLKAVTEYLINFGMKLPNASAVQESGITLRVKTPAPQEQEGTSTGLIVGVVVGMLVVVALVVVVMVFLIRRGYIHPAQQAQSVRRAVSRKVRRTMYGDLGDSRPSGSRNVAYDNRQSELYIYGGMDMEAPQIWHVDRNDVTFETLIKSGHFANIYKARLKRGKGSGDVVVAKTLKERFTPEDELLMKAKINFTGGRIGDHPNVLKFVGAVVSDDAMGPFILYEYCENGTLRDYLLERKDNVSMDLQENLFRFGLDIAKGMEFLAAKGIVHRRLAARNILLTFVNEVKISGFGPQPSEEDGGDSEKGKKERIPIKWVAPECMESTREATEQSDVWSYAVVLWEIFSLGETPYTGKGTDLPKRLKKGERLSKPEQCDDTWYGVMRKCWSYEARKRPKFSDIRLELDNLFVASPGDDYYFYKR